MADPLSIACGVASLVSFALTSSVALSTTIRSFKGQNKQTRALLAELADLVAVLESLADTIGSSPDIDFGALRSPLDRCGKACDDYGRLIARFTKHSTESHASIRDWVKQKYLQGDVSDFKDMIAAYKGTINIGIANVNIRVAALTPRAIEDYKNLMADTTQNLQEHVKDIEERMESLSGSRSNGNQKDDDAERQAMLAEKQSAQQGLDFCAQLSAEIDRLAPALTTQLHRAGAPVTREHVSNGVSATRGSIQDMAARLRKHKDAMVNHLLQREPTGQRSSEEKAELDDLQATKESIEDCLELISGAEKQAALAERHNVFEDITLAENSYSFTVSTVGDLVTARRINITGGSCNVGGQMSNEGLQAAFDSVVRARAPPQRDAHPNDVCPVPAAQPLTLQVQTKNDDPGFSRRYGPGRQAGGTAAGAVEMSRTEDAKQNGQSTEYVMCESSTSRRAAKRDERAEKGGTDGRTK